MYGIHAFTEGGSHATNEDAFAIESHPDDSTCCICVLADGQGGHAGGCPAAQTACRVTIESALAFSPQQLARQTTWPTVLRTADNAVHDAPLAGFTTLVAVCITGSAMCGASSGDSAAIVCNRGKDHQELTAYQAKNPPVGSGGAEFGTFASPLVSPWSVLLMSDGVWKSIGWDSIAAILSDQGGPNLIESLKEAARLKQTGGFQDDFTVVAVEPAAQHPEGH